MDNIKIDKDKYDLLKAATQWYDAMPSSLNNVVGDRFHDNIADFQHENIPHIIDDEVGYVAYIQMRGIHLYVGVNLYTDGGADEETSIQLIADE